MRLRYSYRYIFFIVSIYLFVFQNLITEYLPIFKYFDEFFALLCLPIFVFRGKLKKNTDSITGLLMLCVLIGLISSIIFQYQSLVPVISDILIFCKFFMICYISASMWSENMIDRYKKSIKTNIRIIIMIMFVLTALHYSIGLYSGEIRYGLLSNKLFYSHETYLAAICIFLYSLYLISSNKVLDIYVVALIVILLSTLRVKAFGGALIFAAVVIIVCGTKKRISFDKIIVFGLVLFVLFYNVILYYFFSDRLDMARGQMLIKSIQIANDHFPLGAGFATFGSYYSGEYYSCLYDKYGLSGIWGLSRIFHDYIADAFWPMLIGQFGYIGCIIYMGILYKLLKKIQNSFNIGNIYMYIAKMGCFLYLLVSSIAENSFAGPIAISFAVIIGISSKERTV